MKKLLLSALFVGLVATTQSNAQCTPGNITADFQPLIGTNLPVANIGQSYSTTVLFKAPASITISAADIPTDLLPSQIAPFIGLLPASFTVEVNSMSVGPISGQPTGITGVFGGGSGGSYTPGQQGCLQLSGTATQTGSFVIDLNVEYTITIDASSFGIPLLTGSFPIPQPIPSPSARTYNMSVPTSIEELDANTFDLTNNAPNPFDTKTQILYSNPKPAVVELNVYNMMGTLVFQNSYEAKAGKNAIDFYADKLPGGMYIYNLSNGSEFRTGKMTIAK